MLLISGRYYAGARKTLSNLSTAIVPTYYVNIINQSLYNDSNKSLSLEINSQFKLLLGVFTYYDQKNSIHTTSF